MVSLYFQVYTVMRSDGEGSKPIQIMFLFG